jgi:hypothetical protein
VLLLKCLTADRTTDEGRACTLLTTETVRPENPADGVIPARYVPVSRWELPDDYLPSGPLDLTPYPGGGAPSLTAHHYKVAEPLHGPVWFFLKVYDPDFDGSPFVGRVYAAEGRGGEGGLEPLFTHLGREPDPPPRPSNLVPAHAWRMPLAELGLSAGLIRCLESDGIVTAGDVCVRDAGDLLSIHNLGPARLRELRQKMAAFGLRLWDE